MGISYLYEQWEEMEKALEQIKGAAVLFPDDTDVLYRGAELSLKAGLRDSAEQSLKKVLNIDSGHIKAKRLLGDLHLKDGRKDKAWSEYLPVIDHLILENNYDDAVSLLREFRETDPFETGKRLVSLYRQRGENDRLHEELIRLGDDLKSRDMTEEALSCYEDALTVRPDDEELRKKISSFKKGSEEQIPEQVAGQAPAQGKTIEEIFTEADIFSRYGLLGEAIKLLEGLKASNPQNIDLHARLKTLYRDSGDRELAVTECLVMNELYTRLGKIEKANETMSEAFQLYPEDPRLADKLPGHVHVPDTAQGPAVAEEEEPHPPLTAAAHSAERYEEEISEADFYISQGLTREAETILEKLKDLLPDDKGIQERLARLTGPGEMEEPAETEESSEPADISAGPSIDTTVGGFAAEEGHQETDRSEFEDLVFTDQDLVDAQEIPEPKLDDDVMDIFQEFKKGLEQELEEDDSETHYNLGIAYKEMGLVDDAIKEFQISRNDAKSFIQSSTMLGVCYMEKSFYPLAIDTLQNVMTSITEEEESFWPIKYDLARAYEKNGQLNEALALYTEVYGWNAGFRNVSRKINDIKGRLGNTEREKPKDKKNRVSYL